MKILLVNHTLDFYAGSETFTYTLAVELQRLGHTVICFSPKLGALAERLQSMGIVVTNDLALIIDDIDVIHSHHRHESFLAYARFPDKPMIYVCHGVLPWQEQPIAARLNIFRYVAVSEEVANHLALEHSIESKSLIIIRNAVDLDRFRCEKPINIRPKRALILSNNMPPQQQNLIAEACRRLNIEVTMLGWVQKSAWNVEDHINQVDIVFTLGRGALEAMACKRVVIVYGYNGADGMVTVGNFPILRQHNFSGRTNKFQYSEDDLLKEIEKYQSSISAAVFEYIKKEHGIETIAQSYLQLYKDAIEHQREHLSQDRRQIVVSHMALKELLEDAEKFHKRDAELLQRSKEVELLSQQKAEWDAELLQRSKEIELLSQQKAERDAELLQKTSEIEVLNEHCADIGQQVLLLKIDLQSQQQTAEGEARCIETLTQQLVNAQQKDDEIERLLLKQESLKSLLAEIETSLAWRLVHNYRKVKDLGLPLGSRRRLLYEGFLSRLKGESSENNVGTKPYNRVPILAQYSRVFLKVRDLLLATKLFIREYGFIVLVRKVLVATRVGGVAGLRRAVRGYVAARHPAVRPRNLINIYHEAEQRGLRLREVRQASPPQAHKATVDIIVCVHNALPDVTKCLESIFRNTTLPYSVIIVDDGSGKETEEYLGACVVEGKTKLVRNERARGYTIAANQGLRTSVAEYVILLNSDTQVTHEWLDRMVDCAESDPQIGIVGPISNTASWQSIPNYEDRGDWARNPLPDGLSVDEMAAVVIAQTGRLYPRLPFLNGFCLMIRRTVIDGIGYFDEESFGKGYGEENDYCLRARKSGWQLAVADDVYIYHRQAASYSDEMRKRLYQHADAKLVAKHGQEIISAGVAICQHDRVMQGLRERSRTMLERAKLIRAGQKRFSGRRLLFVLPSRGPAGGSNVVLQESEAMLKMGVDVKILNLTMNRSLFERGYPKLNVPIMYVERSEQIAEVADKFDAVVATAHYSVPWLTSIDGRPGSPVRGYYVQDFEPYFHTSGSKEFNVAMSSYGLVGNLVRVTKTEWNREEVRINTGLDCLVVGPSVNIDIFRPRRRDEAEWPNGPLRIAAMVRPDSPRRSPRFTMEILRETEQKYGTRIEVVIFGCYPEDPDFLALPHDFRWHNLGLLTPTQIAYVLNEVDVFADFSSFQAMGMTSMEAMACGAAAIVPAKGGSPSFAKDGVNSLIVDTQSFDACFSALDRLIQDPDLRWRLQRRGISDMCKFYPEASAYNILDAFFSETTGEDRKPQEPPNCI